MVLKTGLAGSKFKFTLKFYNYFALFELEPICCIIIVFIPDRETCQRPPPQHWFSTKRRRGGGYNATHATLVFLLELGLSQINNK